MHRAPDVTLLVCVCIIPWEVPTLSVFLNHTPCHGESTTPPRPPVLHHSARHRDSLTPKPPQSFLHKSGEPPGVHGSLQPNLRVEFPIPSRTRLWGVPSPGDGPGPVCGGAWGLESCPCAPHLEPGGPGCWLLQAVCHCKVAGQHEAVCPTWDGGLQGQNAAELAKHNFRQTCAGASGG